MNKKGQEMDLIADIALTIIMLSGAYFVAKALITTSTHSDNQIFVESVVRLNNDELFVQYLNSYHKGNKISDLVSYSYLIDDKEYLKKNFEEFIDSIYPRKVCYQLTIEDMEIKTKCKEKEDYPILESEIDIPLISNPKIDILRASLIIEGYQE